MTQLKINNGVVLDYSQDGWAEFKKWLDGTYARLTYAWVDEGLAYQIAAVDGPVCRTCSINKTDATDFEANYKTNAPTTQSVHLDGPESADGAPITAGVKPARPKLTFISCNFCDQTTWFDAAARVVDEVAVDQGDHQDYVVAHGPLIDVFHGKITFEDKLRDANGHSYRVVVKVNGVEKDEQDPHLGTGGDYTLDYALKTVHFLTPLTGTETVQVTYHYAGGNPGLPASTYIVRPIDGKMLIVDRVEVQFSGDIELTDTFKFQAFGLVDACAPQLMQSATIPIVAIDPLNNKVYLPTDVRMALLAGVFAIAGSTGNDGTYHVKSVDVVPSGQPSPAQFTVIKTIEALPSAVADGAVITVALPSGTNIPVAEPLVYKTFLDLLNDSNESHPPYPVLGGSNWRALTKSTYLFTWYYEVGTTLLDPNLGTHIRVWMEHDEKCAGTFGIAAVYCTSEDA